jgi:hypothetical protein
MSSDRDAALALLREEMERPPFHHYLNPQPIDADPDQGIVTIGSAFVMTWHALQTTVRFTGASSPA